MKKFLLPLQNMVRADLFSGSLAVWNALGFRIHFARPIHPRSPQAAEGTAFELFQEYTASWENVNLQKQARGAFRAARIGFERAFLAKRKRIYQEGQKKFFHLLLGVSNLTQRITYPYANIISATHEPRT
jgi:hypothetical protein